MIEFVDVSRLPFAAVVIVVGFVGSRLLTNFLERMGERFAERRVWFKQGVAVGRFAILILTLAIVVGAVGRFSSEVLLAIGGSVAVAVGFAFKDLLASLMAGVILLFDRPFHVGDRVEFAGHYGEVVEIGLRAVRITTLDDNLVSVPNSRFLTDAVSCANSGALDQQCAMSFYIGCREDFDLAKRLVYEAASSSNFVFLKKPITVVLREGPIPEGVERFAIKLTVKAYVFDGRFETAFGTDVTERVHRAFRAHGIQTAGALDEELRLRWGRALLSGSIQHAPGGAEASG